MTSDKRKTSKTAAADAGSEDQANDRVLRIVSGVHAGASRALDPQEMLLVGSSEDCDIVLSDAGVARHHAMLNLAGDASSVRALDAPLRLDGRPVHPGDPVALAPLQRIDLGSAAIAFGARGADGWDVLLPGDAAAGDGPTIAARPSWRRLPLVAALAVGLLAVATVFAMTVPLHTRAPDPQAELAQLNRAFHIEGARIESGVDGMRVLRGTVRDDATIARIRQRLAADGVALDLQLRSGQQIAEDAREVLRASPQPLPTQSARYLGDGKVEIVGRFENEDAVKAAIGSRAMQDAGIKQVLVRNLAEPAPSRDGAPGGAKQPEQPEQLRIVAVVHGNDAHLVALDGTHYAAGDELPGIGRLSAIGETVLAISSDGMIHKVPVRPVTTAELVAAAAAQVEAEHRAQAASAAAAQPAAGTTVEPATKPQPTVSAEAGSGDRTTHI